MSSQTRKYELRARAESQRETRDRIARAAAELHEEKGVAHTTVAEVARRAGVSRLTVYNHFADLSELLPACSAHYASLHPQPDLAAILELDDPVERVRGALAGLYGWYRETEPMTSRLFSDRAAVPELDRFMQQHADRARDELAGGLAAGFGARGMRAERLRALLALAVDFWTWRRLTREGLDDEAAADMMAQAVADAAAMRAGRRGSRSVSPRAAPRRRTPAR
jgi:AcrR family transcriptional regulator